MCNQFSSAVFKSDLWNVAECLLTCQRYEPGITSVIFKDDSRACLLVQSTWFLMAVFNADHVWLVIYVIVTWWIRLENLHYTCILQFMTFVIFIPRLFGLNDKQFNAKREIVLPFNSENWYKWFITWSHAISLLGRWFLHGLPCDVRRQGSYSHLTDQSSTSLPIKNQHSAMRE